jgi:hypothetical protein
MNNVQENIVRLIDAYPALLHLEARVWRHTVAKNTLLLCLSNDQNALAQTSYARDKDCYATSHGWKPAITPRKGDGRRQDLFSARRHMGLFVWAVRLATMQGLKRDRSCIGIGFFAIPMMSMLNERKVCLIVWLG